MKIEIKKLPKSQFEMTVEIPTEKWKGYYDRAAGHLAHHVNIPGFRPGKADAKTLEKNLGAAAIYEEVAEIAVNDTFHKAAAEKEATPVGQPKIEILKLAPGNDIIYKAVFAVMPKIELGDYKAALKKSGLKFEKATVENKDMEEALEYLLNSRSKLATADRPAQKGDRVEIDFSTRLAGVKIDKGESKNHPLVIGKSHFLPEIEAQITGMKAGEEKEFKVVYPKDYYHKELASKKVDFKVKMNLIQEIIKPELNDEFAKMLGNFSDTESLRKSVSEGILLEKEKKAKEIFRTKIIESMIKNFGSDELPEILVEAEKDRIIAEFRHNVEASGIKFEEYISQLNKTEDALKKDWEQTAKSRINNFLISYEIAKKESIKVAEEEVAEQVDKILASYKNAKQAEKEIDVEKLKANIYDMILHEKVLQMLEEIASEKN